MKLRNLFFASVALAGLFTACSNEMDEIVDNNNGQESVEGTAYANFSFAMPSTSGARATGDKEVGSSKENQFDKISIFLFDNNKLGAATVYKKKRTDFTPNTVGGATHYVLREDMLVDKGTYTIHVVLNPTTEFDGVTTLTEFNAAKIKVATGTGAYCTDNTFLMTNAKEASNTIVEITSAHKKGNPAKVNVNVERMAAKIGFAPTKENNKYEIGTTGITVTLDAYKVINTRNGAFGLRRVGSSGTSNTIGGNESSSNYVIDDIFDSKTSAFNSSVFNTNYSRKYDSYVAFRKLTGVQQTLAYLLENTMTQTAQINGWSTGVIFRGKLNTTPNNVIGEVDSKGNLYRYDGQFYASLAEIAKLTGDVLGTEGKTETDLQNYLTSINSREKLITFGVEFFVGGYCYYQTWLRHNNNNNPEVSGIMEFAIVRNNVYQVTVSKIGQVGSFTSGTPGPKDPSKPADGQDDFIYENGQPKPNPEIPGDVADLGEPKDPVIPIKPIDPNESSDVYLNISVDVLPWIVRENDFEL